MDRSLGVGSFSSSVTASSNKVDVVVFLVANKVKVFVIGNSSMTFTKVSFSTEKTGVVIPTA